MWDCVPLALLSASFGYLASAAEVAQARGVCRRWREGRAWWRSVVLLHVPVPCLFEPLFVRRATVIQLHPASFKFLKNMRQLDELCFLGGSASAGQMWPLVFDHVGAHLTHLTLQGCIHILDSTVISVCQQCELLTTLVLRDLPSLTEAAICSLILLPALQYLILERLKSVVHMRDLTRCPALADLMLASLTTNMATEACFPKLTQFHMSDTISLFEDGQPPDCLQVAYADKTLRLWSLALHGTGCVKKTFSLFSAVDNFVFSASSCLQDVDFLCTRNLEQITLTCARIKRADLLMLKRSHAERLVCKTSVKIED